MADLKKNFIAGEWHEGGVPREDINPSNLDDVVGMYVQAGPEQVEAAVHAGHMAAPEWAGATRQPG